MNTLKKLSLLPQVWVKKIHCDHTQGSGIADLVACINGHFVAIETKFGTTLHGAQGVNGREIIQAGGDFLVVDSMDKVDELMLDIYHGRRFKKC